MGIEFAPLPEARSDNDPVPQATTVIEQTAFGSFLGLPQILTFEDVDTGERETFAFAKGLSVTYGRMITLISGRIFSLNPLMGLIERDDDGIARIWSRVKLPERITSVLKESGSSELKVNLVNIAAEAFHEALIRLGEGDPQESNKNEAKTIFKAVVNRIEGIYFESLVNPVTVRNLAMITAPLRTPPWWITVAPPYSKLPMPTAYDSGY